MSDTLLIKVQVPEWVPQDVRKEIAKEIEETMLGAINDVWGKYAPEVVSSRDVNSKKAPDQ